MLLKSYDANEKKLLFFGCLKCPVKGEKDKMGHIRIFRTETLCLHTFCLFFFFVAETIADI